MSDSVNILSVNISKKNLKETTDLMCSWIDSKQKKRMCVTPTNCVLWAYKDERLRNVYNTSDLNLADGVPLIWASKLFGNKIRGRVTGLDLLPEFARIASEKKYSFFFLGAKEGVGQALANSFKRTYPKLDIAGVYSPPFAERFSDEENKKMVEMINILKPNVLWVSLTAPKQDHWIFEHLDKLNVNVAIGVGGAFEVSAGLIKRAPKWMQRSGLEWFYRFLQEPTRLFKRYFVEAPIFIPLIVLQKLGFLKKRIG